MKVEVQLIVSEVMEDIFEISEKEILDVIKNPENIYNMSMDEALKYIATQKVEDKYYQNGQYDDITVDHVRILE